MAYEPNARLFLRVLFAEVTGVLRFLSKRRVEGGGGGGRGEGLRRKRLSPLLALSKTLYLTNRASYRQEVFRIPSIFCKAPRLSLDYADLVALRIHI